MGGGWVTAWWRLGGDWDAIVFVCRWWERALGGVLGQDVSVCDVALDEAGISHVISWHMMCDKRCREWPGRVEWAEGMGV